MWILTACFSGSLKFYSLSAQMHHCIRTSHLEKRGAGLVDQAAAKTHSCLFFFVCLSQRPEPQGGAAVRQRERRSHAESPELFYFKSTPQSLLPGLCVCVCVRSDHQWWSESQHTVFSEHFTEGWNPLIQLSVLLHTCTVFWFLR